MYSQPWPPDMPAMLFRTADRWHRTNARLSDQPGTVRSSMARTTILEKRKELRLLASPFRKCFEEMQTQKFSKRNAFCCAAWCVYARKRPSGEASGLEKNCHEGLAWSI